MKFKTVFLILLLSSITACGSTRSRTLVVSGPPDDPAVQTAFRKFDSEKTGLHVRDVEIKREPAQDFSVRLIGKDGTEKWQTENEDFKVKEIFDRIDEMPMRQEEILRQRVLP